MSITVTQTYTASDLAQMHRSQAARLAAQAGYTVLYRVRFHVIGKRLDAETLAAVTDAVHAQGGMQVGREAWSAKSTHADVDFAFHDEAAATRAVVLAALLPVVQGPRRIPVPPPAKRR